MDMCHVSLKTQEELQLLSQNGSKSFSLPTISLFSLHFSYFHPHFSVHFPSSSLLFSLPLRPCLLLYSQQRWRARWSRWTSSSWWCRRPSAERSPCTCSRRPSSSGTSESSQRCSAHEGRAYFWQKPPWPILLRCTAGWSWRRGSSQRVIRASRRWWTWSSQPWEDQTDRAECKVWTDFLSFF